MRELERIIEEVGRLRARGAPGVLATVVDVAGSSYRLPGARMLVTATEWLAGSISGGCLESDVVARAADVIRNDAATVVTYDTTDDEDIVFGVGLGCRGVIRVLLEPVAAAPPQTDFASFAGRCLDERQAGLVAMVVSGNSAKAGTRLLSVSGGTVATDIENSSARVAIETHIVRSGEAASGLRVLGVPEGSIEVFFETIRQPAPLIVFGAGHDAMPLVRLAKELGWHVTVVDHRPAYATERRFPTADRVVVAGSGAVPDGVTLTADTLAVIMTHNYLRDLALIKALLPSPARYIGLLGPRKRALELIEEAKQQGFEATSEQLERFYAPVGLDLGSENPEEVALSIVAEMRAVTRQRTPLYLREKSGPIHGASTAKSGADLLSSFGRTVRSNNPVCPTTT